MSKDSSQLSAKARALIKATENALTFSAASVWEVALKSKVRRGGFALDPNLFRRSLIDSGYEELPISSAHAAATHSLPMIHADPFDRLLVAQARVEGITLLTSDRQITRYEGPIVKV